MYKTFKQSKSTTPPLLISEDTKMHKFYIQKISSWL